MHTSPFPLSASDARIAARQDATEAHAGSGTGLVTHTCHLQPVACFGDALTWRSAWCDTCDAHFVTSRPTTSYGDHCPACIDKCDG